METVSLYLFIYLYIYLFIYLFIYKVLLDDMLIADAVVAITCYLTVRDILNMRLVCRFANTCILESSLFRHRVRRVITAEQPWNGVETYESLRLFNMVPLEYCFDHVYDLSITGDIYDSAWICKVLQVMPNLRVLTIKRTGVYIFLDTHFGATHVPPIPNIHTLNVEGLPCTFVMHLISQAVNLKNLTCKDNSFIHHIPISVIPITLKLTRLHIHLFSDALIQFLQNCR